MIENNVLQKKIFEKSKINDLKENSFIKNELNQMMNFSKNNENCNKFEENNNYEKLKQRFLFENFSKKGYQISDEDIKIFDQNFPKMIENLQQNSSENNCINEKKKNNGLISKKQKEENYFEKKTINEEIPVNLLENFSSQINNSKKRHYNEKKNEIWEETLNYLKEKNYENAYKRVLISNDEIYLIKLMILTGSCIKNLTKSTAKVLLIRISKIMNKKLLFNIFHNFMGKFVEKNPVFLSENLTISDLTALKLVLNGNNDEKSEKLLQKINLL